MSNLLAVPSGLILLIVLPPPDIPNPIIAFLGRAQGRTIIIVDGVTARMTNIDYAAIGVLIIIAIMIASTVLIAKRSVTSKQIDSIPDQEP